MNNTYCTTCKCQVSRGFGGALICSCMAGTTPSKTISNPVGNTIYYDYKGDGVFKKGDKMCENEKDKCCDCADGVNGEECLDNGRELYGDEDACEYFTSAD